MLKEAPTSQKEDNIFRRWFQDEYFDLFIWYNKEDNSISGFQLCYDKEIDEHAFTWLKNSGFSHNRVEDTHAIGKHPATPILIDDGYFPFEDIKNRFTNSAENIDKEIRDLVIGKISEYSGI